MTHAPALTLHAAADVILVLHARAAQQDTDATACQARSDDIAA